MEEENKDNQKRFEDILREFQKNKVIEKYLSETGKKIKIYSKGFVFPFVEGLVLNDKQAFEYYHVVLSGTLIIARNEFRYERMGAKGTASYLDSKEVKPEKFQKKLSKIEKKLARKVNLNPESIY